MATERYVIIGASLAGAKAAETLRQEGFDGPVLLLGDEPVRPYERPPLSKGYLRGEASFDDAAVHPAGFYEEQDIELRTSTSVVAIDRGASEVETAGGERLGFDRLLLATGSSPRRLSGSGASLEGILYLRSVADADALRAAITSSGPVVVVGAGWIGCEVAASARQLGADVSMVEPARLPLERVLGAELGEFYRDVHAAHGVGLHFGVGVEEFRGDGRVEEVRLSDGTVLPAATVVVGIGIVPRTELAEAAGLSVDNGVVTDEFLATSAAGIWAAGDVANALYPAYRARIRLEHWSAALNQGPVAARNMLGRSIPYAKVPYFYSDQYDVGMEYRGWAPDYDEVVFRGDRTGGEFLAFWLAEGVVRAAMNVNVWDQGDAIEAIIGAARPVDAARLTDPDVDLAGLATAGP